MSRVGIITFQESNNYGAMLQAYALKSVIKELGYQADVINYHSKEKEEQYSHFSIHRSLLVNINHILSLRISKKNKKKIDEFKKDMLELDSTLVYQNELAALNDKYDKFVCGSDQIWNPRSIKNDGTFFLDFVNDPERRISYAPSIGVSELEEKDAEFLKCHIQGIKYLSVREKSGADLIRNYAERDALVTLDPTLLIDKDKWISLCGENKHNNKYIFLYMVGYTPEAVNLAKELGRITGYDVFAPIKTIRDYKDGFKPFFGGPLEFMNEIRNASYVVTTSFHGLMFSIIFQKQFLTVEKPASKSKTASRINDFLRMINLENRIYSGNLDQINEEIDYSIVSQILSGKRKESMDFLINSLNS